MTAVPPPRPLWLALTPDPVFGTFHATASEPAGATAVLICPPWGWDEITSYASRRAWAERLASDGHPTLRIDLPGTGDSGGTPADPDRVGAWVGAIVGGAAWLADRPGVRRVAMIGLGLSGLLAGRAITAGAPIDDLILWAAPSRGRAFLREQRAFAAMQSSRFSLTGEPEPTLLPEGWLEIGGFVLSAETVDALAAVELASMPAGRLRRALLLERDGMGHDRELEAEPDGPRRHGDDRTRPRLDEHGLPPGTLRTAAGRDREGLRVAGRRSGWTAGWRPERPERGVRGCGCVRARSHRCASSWAAKTPAFGRRRSGSASRSGTCSGSSRSRPPVHDPTIARLPERGCRPSSRSQPSLGRGVAGLERSGRGHRSGWTSRASATLTATRVGILRSGTSTRPRGCVRRAAILDELDARGFGPRFALIGLCAGGYWAFNTGRGRHPRGRGGHPEPTGDGLGPGSPDPPRGSQGGAPSGARHVATACSVARSRRHGC